MTPEPHWIRPLVKSPWPATFVYLDTEANRRQVSGLEEQTWLCGVAAIDRRAHDRAGWHERLWTQTTDVDALWDWIALAFAPQHRTVIVCHNLSYDLRIADMLRQLDQRGYRLGPIMLDRELAWASWSRGTSTVTAVDMTTILPMALDKVGELVGRSKPPLPNQHATLEEWLARCRADVEILAAAWRELADWLQGDDLGPFAPTGAGLAWNVWRRRHLDGPVLGHPPEPHAEVARRAAWTGRAEAWRHGQFGPGRWVEWDYTSAYAQVGLRDTVPIGQVDALRSISVATAGKIAARKKLLVEVEVRCSVPVLPAELDGQIVWPVGTYRTVVWWGELADALAQGAIVQIRRAWAWKHAPALRSFMAWAMEHIDGRAEGVTPLRAAVAKHWARTLVGRMGLRYTEWDDLDDCPWGPGYRSETIRDPDGRLRRALLLGSVLKVEAGRVDGKDSAPQIMSYVMSQTRRMLWHAMLVAGLDHLVHVDTDGLIVDGEGDAALAAIPLPGLRRKRLYRDLEVIGTRALVLDGKPRAAGMQSKAVRAASGVFEVEEWERAGRSLASGRPDRVRVQPRRKTLKATDLRRIRTPGGSTIPRWVAVGEGGENVALDVAPLEEAAGGWRHPPGWQRGRVG
jgi:hypothetical protein